VSVKLLKLIKEKVSPKTPYGLYASTSDDGITVGLSDFRFREGQKPELTAFLTLEFSPSVKEIAVEALKEEGISLNEVSFAKVAGEKTSAWLVKLKLPPEFENNSRLEAFKRAAKKLERFRTAPPEENTIPQSYFTTPSETGNSLIDALTKLAQKHRIKVVIPLGNALSIEVNSLHSPEEGKVYAGVRKKLARGFFSEEELEFTLPSDGFLTHGDYFVAHLPFDGRSFEETVREVEKARANPANKNPNPCFGRK